MFYTVDRKEDGWVVLVGDGDSGGVLEFPEYFFDFALQEGDVLTGELSPDGLPFGLLPDEAETEARRARIHSKFERLKNKGDNEQ